VTLSKVCRIAIPVALCLFTCSALAQVVDIKAYGRPRNTSKFAHYEVWYDEEGWHVRSDTAGKSHLFAGGIEVVGGKVTKVTNFESLEAVNKKKKKRPDIGQVTDNNKKILFEMRTEEYGDGFTFQVTEGAKSIRFRLLIDGHTEPERIFIGGRSQPAPAATFELDAHPAP